MPTLPTLGEVFVRLNRYFDCVYLEEEVWRKMNFTYLLVLAVLTDVVKVFPVSSSSFARKTTGRNRARSHSGGMTRPKDEIGSQIVSSESNISHAILVYLSRNNNSQAQPRRFPGLTSTAPEPEFPVIFGSKWDPLTSACCQGCVSPERLAELKTGVSPLQKRISKWDFYNSSSCNLLFHICFCHNWWELPL